ncbi:MAG: hypothetical protein K2J93_06135 [Anaeroplasmataceae bacterium]|nr:hypothetical protein [Anaeroplasmataceae bacterium]
MKKILLPFLLIFCLFCSCAPKETPAEIIFIDENQEEVSYQITKTDHLDEVKEIFDKLNKVKINSKFNGVSIDLITELEGKVVITNQEVRTIDLGYTLNLDAIANLKKYRMSGNVILDGFTNTDSDSLSLNTKNKLSVGFVNDDAFMFVKGNLEEGSNRLSLKNKINIQEITSQYKTIISSSIDLMKYYNPLDFIPEYNEVIDSYNITISKTTKDSFTLRLQVPANQIFKELDTDLKLTIEMEISCVNLLPIRLEFEANDIISMILENEYVEKYLSSTVKVEKAKLKVDLKLKYDYFEVKELTEEEKINYKEYSITKYDK